MLKNITYCFTIIYLLFCGSMAGAVSYTPKISVNTHWNLESSVFECKLIQDIPYYGKAVFYHRSGDPVMFYLEPKRELMREGKASLVIAAPPWKPGMNLVDLGMVDVRGSDRSVKLSEKLAFRMLMGLKDGMSPTFEREPWYDDNRDSLKVSLSSINFLPLYREYNDCVAQLLPVNYDQIARSVVLFRSTKHELSAKHRKQLSDIVTYVQADKSVKFFFIDGHTDSNGTKSDNITLSQRRAESVAQYLVENGVDIDAVAMRYHGERYPIASNNDEKGRARNRRVTIRLEREENPDAQSYE